jgi:amino acid adenylation domain-containing protein
MDTNYEGIAIIGMSGRFPGAGNVDEFWRNLLAGVESISFFSDEELAASGLDVAQLRKDPSNVAARGVVKDAEWFDAALFNISPKEAEVIDPQQRLFLEASWEVLENAGYDPARAKGYIGVYAGMSPNSYFWNNVFSHPDAIKTVGRSTAIGDFLATRVAYKLNLRGPALSLYTACSTSLVAVCQACQALLGYQCDIALAGGVSVSFPQKRTYYQDGGMFSPDGQCRPFDARGAGTIFSDGLGIVALKRLAEAVHDGDQIYAVIKGFGLNNDGSAKAGFAAPSVNGQAEVIALAQAQAGFEPDTISYIETHGTGTPLGDPIEIEGLTQAFRAGTSRKNFCAIGSVKGNIGHADSAAGVASLIKTALALKEEVLPASLNFAEPNPKIDFANSPFHVNSQLTEWKAGPTPRRAGVSGFGIGGTNVHLVLEESPIVEPSGPTRDWQLLLLSARTSSALDAATTRFRDHLKAHPDLNLADAAFTLQSGRRVFDHRRMLVCRDSADAIQTLETGDPKRVLTQQGKMRERPVVFMFPGQGAQYVNMGADLYRTEPAFKAEVDLCAEILLPHLNLDLRSVLFPPAEQAKAAEDLLIQTRITQPALFVIEYALAKLWISWGVQPRAMIGHSVGEYVAACLAGVFTLEEALALVAGRGRLIQALPGGAMLAVRLPESDVRPQLPDDLAIAAVNSVSLCVVSGPTDAIEKFEARLKTQGVAARRLQTSHAFHSAMLDSAVQPLTALLDKVRFNNPSIPYVSNVTGRWITEDEAKDPAYWTSHLRQAVRFADGVGELLKDSENILLEVGPGQTLTSLANQHPEKTAGHVVVSSFSASRDQDLPAVLGALGRLWLAGAPVDWAGFYSNEKRHRVSLPTYPFERKRFWIEPARPSVTQRVADDSTPTAGGDSSFGPSGTADLSPTQAPAIDAMNKGSSAGAPDTTLSRRDRILAMLTTQFQELSSANLADVGPSASFMEMGLDSLFLGQASIAIETRFGVRITFRQMFEELSTLNGLADYLDHQLPPDAFAPAPVTPARPTAAPAPAPASAGSDSTLEAMQAQLRALTEQMEILRRGSSSQRVAVPSAAPDPDIQTDDPASALESPTSQLGADETGVISLPLTDSQTELWLASQSGEESSLAFNQVFTLRLGGELDAEALSEIIQQLVDRHDALRTTFAADGSSQMISPSAKIVPSIRDLSALSDVEQEQGVADAMAWEDRTLFDLAHGPLFRTQLLKLSGNRFALILAAHHIILDGWSIGILLREFTQLHAAHVRGIPANLEPAMQYRQYVQWQNAPEHRSSVNAAEAYWLGQFARLPNDFELPSDRPRPPIKTYHVAQTNVLLDPALYALLKQAAAAHGCTLFVFLLAAFKAWMFRLTGEGDLVVGIPAAGQLAVAGYAGNKSLIGHCVNTLPLRSQCDGSVRFSDHLKTVKSLLLDAYEHQNITLGTLVRKLKLRPDPSRAPLIPLMFNLGRAGRQLQLPGAHVSFPDKAFNFFDLNIDAQDTGKEIDVICRYNSDLFGEAHAGRMLNHFRTLLAAAVADPDRTLLELPLLTDTERQQIVVDWNRTEVDYPKGRYLPELIEDQVARTPDAVAVVFEDRQLTYRELNARSNQLARHLQKLGVGPDTLVGICVERSLEMVVGLVGILKAGGAYVPLDPEYPKDRLAFMLEDAAVPVLLTQAHLVETLPPSAAHVIRLDTDWPTIAAESDANVASGVKAGQLAYMIYTSGSTGRPKGAMNTHEAILNRLQWMQDAYRLTPADRVLQKTPFSFDVSVWEFFWPLLTGATLVVARPGGHRDGAYLANLIAEEKITTTHFVPSMLQVFLEQDGLDVSCSSLKRVICSGEALPLELQRRFFYTMGTELHNLYGPTEAAVDVTYWACERNSPLNTVPIGRPISNIQIYILDAQLQPVPIGIPGELHIGGVGLARGYHNRPDLTAEKFIPDPYNTAPGARLYKTGDLARFFPDGNVEYLGRLDSQVKIRGFRVELGEIEEALNQHPGVETSVVIAREDTPGDKRLIAYVVSRNGAVNPSELRDTLRIKLPDYMVPAAFVPLEALPLSPNGKVDRKALPRPDFEAAADKSNFVAPSTPTEIVLAGIWCDVLGLKQIGIHDNFFDLGGHSILAVQITSKINRSLGSHLAIPVIFQNPTIGKLAAALEQDNQDQVAQWKHDPRATSPLITFQAKGNRPPLFFLHGDWTGDGFYCGRLSQQLGDEQPFYVLPPYRAEKEISMEDMASFHVATIQQHTPHGPYFLGGYCIGALVAAEVARQLVAKGEKVIHLLLIDPTPSSNPWPRLSWPLINTVGDIRKWDLQKRISYIDRYAVPLGRWLASSTRIKLTAVCNRLGLAHLIKPAPVAAGQNDGDDDEEVLDGLDYEVYMLAFRLFKLKPLPVPTTFYLPIDSPPSRLSWLNHVRRIFLSVTIEMIPGNHRTCVIDHASVLAQKMKKTIDLS